MFNLAYLLHFWLKCCGVVDRAAALKCNGHELESSLAGHLNIGSVHWRERPGMRAHGGVHSVSANFFNLSLKLTNHKCLTTK